MASPASARVTIPRGIADPWYRYTRDPVTLSARKARVVEWTNARRVLSQLTTVPFSEIGQRKQEEHVARVLARALNTSVVISSERTFLIRGTLTADEVDAAFERAAVPFYLCAGCRLPERLESGACRACGFREA